MAKLLKQILDHNITCACILACSDSRPRRSIRCRNSLWCPCILFCIHQTSKVLTLIRSDRILRPLRLLLWKTSIHLAILRIWHPHIRHMWISILQLILRWLSITLHLSCQDSFLVFLWSTFNVTTHHNLVRKKIRLMLIPHLLYTC